MLKLLETLRDFYYPEVEEEGLNLVRVKCDQTIAAHDPTDLAFERALDLRMKVDSFEANLAKNKPIKPKFEFKLDPGVIIAAIGVAGQIVCTVLVERFQANEGMIFKSGSTGWIGGNNVFTKMMSPFRRE